MGAQHFANLFGETGEPIVLGIFVFLLGILSLKFTTTSTIYAYLLNQNYNVYFGCYNSCCINVLSILSTDQSTIRLRGFDFHPNLLFSIRFGYRVEKIVELAHQRLSTILIGGATCIFISLFICPVWAGETLHNTIASNIEKLANYLEGMLINLSLSIIFECIPRFIYLFIFSLLKIKTKKTLNIIIIGVYRIWR